MTGEVNIALLRTFLVAHRSGSMTRTAELLGLSQPGVTAQIHNLEKQLGSSLFRRTSRGLRPTTAGDELAARVGLHVDALLDAVTDTLHDTTPADPFRRTVLLGGPVELTSSRVLPALADLYERGLRLRVTIGLAEDLLRELTAGALDLVVSTVRPRGRAVRAAPLADEEFLLVAAPHLAHRIDPDHLAADPRAALAAVPVVAYDEQLPIVRRYWRHVFDHGPPPTTPSITVPDLRAVAAACVAGAGYSVLPRYLIREHLAAATLTLLHDPPDPPINTLFLAWPAAAPGDSAISAVRTQLRMNARLW